MMIIPLVNPSTMMGPMEKFAHAKAVGYAPHAHKNIKRYGMIVA